MDRHPVPVLRALVIVSLAALVTACAVFAPLYDRAIQQADTELALDEGRMTARC